MTILGYYALKKSIEMWYYLRTISRYGQAMMNKLIMNGLTPIPCWSQSFVVYQINNFHNKKNNEKFIIPSTTFRCDRHNSRFLYPSLTATRSWEYRWNILLNKSLKWHTFTQRTNTRSKSAVSPHLLVQSKQQQHQRFSKTTSSLLIVARP